jgi:hypothetical protein
MMNSTYMRMFSLNIFRDPLQIKSLPSNLYKVFQEKMHSEKMMIYINSIASSRYISLQKKR